MLLSILKDADGSRCTLTYEPADHWLRATWRGYVNNAEAMRGAENYLSKLALIPSPYLLHDNLALRGPWFDSLAWLEHAWLPHALRLGLRCIAHVVRPDAHLDVLALRFPKPLHGRLALQIFHEVPEAQP